MKNQRTENVNIGGRGRNGVGRGEENVGRGGREGGGRGRVYQGNRNNSAGGSEAERMFDDYCADINAKGLYLDAVIALEKLDIKNLHSLSTFRDIQKLNQIVNVTVTCYIHTHGIHLYSELEMIILRSINRWQKRGEVGKPMHLSFEEVGIGSLTAHKQVAAFFMFMIPSDRYRLPELQMDDILSSALSFLTQIYYKKSPELRNVKDKSNEINAEFNSFLRVKLSEKYRCSDKEIGLNIQFRDFSCSHNSIINEKTLKLQLNECVSQCRNQHVDIYREELIESMSVLRLGSTAKPDDSRITNTIRCLGDIDIDIKAAHLKLKDLLSTTEPEDSFESCFLAVQESEGYQGFIQQIPSKSSIDLTYIHTAGKLTDWLEGPEKYVVYSKQLPDFLVSFVTAFVCFMSIKESGSTKKKKKNNKFSSTSYSAPQTDMETLTGMEIESGAWESIHSILEEKLLEGIPDFALKALESFLPELVNQEAIVPIPGEQNILTYNLDAVRYAVSAQLAGRQVKPKGKNLHIINKNLFIAAITAIVIMHRILRTEPSKNFATRPLVDVILRAIPEMLEESLASKGNISDPVAFLVETLRSLELKIVKALDIPAFGCLQKGSFLYYMGKLHAPLLSELFKVDWCDTNSLNIPSITEAPLREIDNDEVISSLTICVEQLIEYLSFNKTSNNRRDFLNFILALENAVVQKLGCVSFHSTTGKTLPHFIASLVDLRDNEGPDQLTLDVGKFCVTYDSLLNVISSYNDSTVTHSYCENPVDQIISVSHLLESEAIRRSISQYMEKEDEKHIEKVNLREFLSKSVGVTISEEEENLLLCDFPSISTKIPSTVHFFIPVALKPTASITPLSCTDDIKARTLRLLARVPFGSYCLSMS